MHGISTLEVSVLCRELDAEYAGFHVEKFYDLGEGRFRMKVRGNGRDVSLLVYLCRAVCPATYIEGSEQPSPFAMAVRKRTAGAVIEGVEQLGRDRIIVMRLRKGGAVSSLILEMFGKGNLIIADGAMRITLAYAQHDFRDRSTRIGRTYSPPPAIARAKAGTLMARVSAEADVGPIYVEDAIAREGLSPREDASSASRASVDRVLEALSGIGGKGALVYTRGGEVVDYSLSPLKKYDGLERRGFGTLAEALSFAYGRPAEESRDNPEERRLEASMARQKGLVLSTLGEAETSREAGRLVFARMGELNQLIEAARANRRITLEELRAMFPHIGISDINLKDKTVTVEV